jgi:tyrosyl-DNA phosphodiesterase 2
VQKRLDRFACKFSDFKVDNIEMIGKEAIPGITYIKEKKVRQEIRNLELPVFPSDHFGLVLTISSSEKF